MITVLDDFQDLMRRVEQHRRHREQVRGRVEHRKEEMEKRYGVRTKKEADEMREKLRIRAEESSEEYLEEKTQFEKEWEHILKEKT